MTKCNLKITEGETFCCCCKISTIMKFVRAAAVSWPTNLVLQM